MFYTLFAVICMYDVRENKRYHRHVWGESDSNFRQKKNTEKQAIIGKITLWNIQQSLKRGGGKCNNKYKCTLCLLEIPAFSFSQITISKEIIGLYMLKGFATQ